MNKEKMQYLIPSPNIISFFIAFPLFCESSSYKWPTTHGFSSFYIYCEEEMYFHGFKKSEFFVINILSSRALALPDWLIH